MELLYSCENFKKFVGSVSPPLWKLFDGSIYNFFNIC